MQVHAQTRSLLFKAADPFAVRALLAQSRTLDQSEFNLAVRHTAESTRVLRNIGLDAPSPIATYYDWPKIQGRFEPFDHQRLMAEFMTLNRRCFNLGDMGIGKTAAALWAADWLMREGIIHKALVLAPLQNLEQTWEREIFDTLMHRKSVIVHGTQEKRMKMLAADVDFYLLNHDGVAIAPVREEIKKRQDIDLIIVDEGSLFRNHDADRYKFLHSMVASKPWIWWLTGTPTPNAPTDAWSQIRIISPGRVHQYFGGFKRQTMLKVSEHIWKPRPEAVEMVYKAMQPAIRFSKADCLDLPPVMTESWGCDLSAEQKKAFKAMRNQMIIEAQKGEPITAVNAADRLNKLRQILCGAVKRPDGEYDVLNHEPRLKVLKDAIDLATAKVLVIVPFKGIIRALEKELPYTTGVLNGDIPIGVRNATIKAFKETDDPHTLLCHPKVMSHGLNLVEADVLIFYAPIFSNDEYRQVVERFNRPGQTRKMTVIRIGADPIEWAIYKTLDKRQFTQYSILKLYKSVVTGDTFEVGDGY